MKLNQYLACVSLLLVAGVGTANAELSVKVDCSKSSESKAVVKLTMTNTYSNAVESARAAVFLLDENGKMVGQKAEWVIGGNKARPSLAPNGTAIYYVTVATDKPFKKASVIFTRIVLEGGKVIEAGKGFELQK